MPNGLTQRKKKFSEKRQVKTLTIIDVDIFRSGNKTAGRIARTNNADIRDIVSARNFVAKCAIYASV